MGRHKIVASKKRIPKLKLNPRRRERLIEIVGILLIGIALLALAALLSKDVGFVGGIMKNILHYIFGQNGSFIPAIFIAFMGGLLLWQRNVSFLRRSLSMVSLSLWLLLLVHLLSEVQIADNTWELAGAGSGLIGHFLALTALKFFGDVGTVILLLVWLLVSIILILNKTLKEILMQIMSFLKGFCEKVYFCKAKEEGLTSKQAQDKFQQKKEEFHEGFSDFQEKHEEKQRHKTSNLIISTLQNVLKEKEPREAKPKVSPKEKLAKNQEALLPGNHKPGRALGPYKLPDIQLIETVSSIKQQKNIRITDQSPKLEETFANFGIKVKVLEAHHGPTVTRYDLQPAPGIKVSRIVNLTDDIALALAAKGVRIEAPIPGKSAIGIEIPNQDSKIVIFREVLESAVFWRSSKISIALGLDIAGEVVIADLGKMPHLLVAGSTGSGKSVCVNTLIMSILYKAFPNEVKFLMIDPKMVELSVYNGIPHLMAPVVTEAKKAAGALKLVVDEMERRYKLFSEARVRDLEKYNQSLGEEAEKLPYIIVLIDELADLMMVAPVEVEDYICRLAQMARATGIHLVVATQRPSVDVITGLIKANVPSRIAFAVSSQIDSRTILDGVGAEKLLGRGDMLFSPVGSMKPRRIQGALVTEKEIELVISHWKEQGEPQYQEQFMNIPDKKEAAAIDEEDELFWDAVKLVAEHQQASASILQRRLRIGYTRAARLIDVMESRKMIGGFEGSKSREVYISPRQLEELMNNSKEA